MYNVTYSRDTLRFYASFYDNPSTVDIQDAIGLVSIFLNSWHWSVEYVESSE
jgi:hypothetical protein